VATVQVQVATPYAVEIESGLLRRAGERLRDTFSERTRFFAVTVPPVNKYWGANLQESLTAAGLTCVVVEMKDGERNKNLHTVEELAQKLIAKGADRKSVVLAFGGGVVGDVAAFLASIYMRGIEVVQIPTTLLAQVDASIGGKTGVDLKAGKNLLGTFHQPRLVLTDPAVLSTLDDRQFRAGLYEALKAGVIRSPELFRYMEENRERILQRDAAALEYVISECIRVKAEVVAADPHEAGLRRILNFGHTIGHALEAETSYRQFLHGEAVGWGMVAASMISAAMQISDGDTARRIISIALAYATLPKVDVRGKKIVRRLGVDKKTVNGMPHFILPVKIGQVEVVRDVPERAVIQAVDELRYLSLAG
jgi:3-dehydroquinate synthase